MRLYDLNSSPATKSKLQLLEKSKKNSNSVYDTILLNMENNCENSSAFKDGKSNLISTIYTRRITKS